MPRIRSIKPGFCSSEDIASLPLEVRLHFILLWTYADDAGRGKDNPRLLKAELYPLDDGVTTEMVRSWQAILSDQDRIRRYVVDGKSFFEVVNWGKHQKPQHPRESEIPPVPDDWVKPSEPPERPHEASPETPPVVVVEREREMEGSIAPGTPPARRDPLFDALVFVCGINPAELTPTARSAANKALKDLRSVKADPDELPARAAVYRSRWPDTTLTPSALAKHWSQLNPDTFVNQPKINGNQAALMRAAARKGA